MRAGGNSLFPMVLAGGLSIAYAVFAHYASATPGIGPWAILLASAPLIIVGVSFASANRRAAILCLPVIAGLAGLAWFWPQVRNPVGWVYFLQHVSINLMLGLIFGRSLVRQRKPLCTVIARLVHEEMTPELLRYTRQVTLAWALFFLVSAVLSILLFVLAPIEAWSVFANILTLPLVVVMFVVENEVRKRVLPPRDQVGLRATVCALRARLRS